MLEEGSSRCLLGTSARLVTGAIILVVGAAITVIVLIVSNADNSQNLTLELVAYVHPTVAGAYRISVSSKGGAGAVILIGKTLSCGRPESSLLSGCSPSPW